MSNTTKPIVYAIWPSACAVVIAALGVVYHPSIAAYIVSGVIWAGGIGIMLYQIQTGEDTNLMPYIVMIISAVVFGIWATSGPTF